MLSEYELIHKGWSLWDMAPVGGGFLYPAITRQVIEKYGWPDFLAGCGPIVIEIETPSSDGFTDI